jgi:hypothetical protein
VALRRAAAKAKAEAMSPDKILGLAGLAATLLAALAGLADRRRLRRSDLDRVGWVPWTPVFFFALLAAVVLLALAAKVWFAS